MGTTPSTPIGDQVVPNMLFFEAFNTLEDAILYRNLTPEEDLELSESDTIDRAMDLENVRGTVYEITNPNLPDERVRLIPVRRSIYRTAFGNYVVIEDRNTTYYLTQATNSTFSAVEHPNIGVLDPAFFTALQHDFLSSLHSENSIDIPFLEEIQAPLEQRVIRPPLQDERAFAYFNYLMHPVRDFSAVPSPEDIHLYFQDVPEFLHDPSRFRSLDHFGPLLDSYANWFTIVGLGFAITNMKDHTFPEHIDAQQLRVLQAFIAGNTNSITEALTIDTMPENNAGTLGSRIQRLKKILTDFSCLNARIDSPYQTAISILRYAEVEHPMDFVHYICRENSAEEQVDICQVWHYSGCTLGTAQAFIQKVYKKLVPQTAVFTDFGLSPIQMLAACTVLEADPLDRFLIQNPTVLHRMETFLDSPGFLTSQRPMDLEERMQIFTNIARRDYNFCPGKIPDLRILQQYFPTLLRSECMHTPRIKNCGFCMLFRLFSMNNGPTMFAPFYDHSGEIVEVNRDQYAFFECLTTLVERLIEDDTDIPEPLQISNDKTNMDLLRTLVDSGEFAHEHFHIHDRVYTDFQHMIQMALNTATQVGIAARNEARNHAPHRTLHFTPHRKLLETSFLYESQLDFRPVLRPEWQKEVAITIRALTAVKAVYAIEFIRRSSWGLLDIHYPVYVIYDIFQKEYLFDVATPEELTIVENTISNFLEPSSRNKWGPVLQHRRVTLNATMRGVFPGGLHVNRNFVIPHSDTEMSFGSDFATPSSVGIGHLENQNAPPPSVNSYSDVGSSVGITRLQERLPECPATHLIGDELIQLFTQVKTAVETMCASQPGLVSKYLTIGTSVASLTLSVFNLCVECNRTELDGWLIASNALIVASSLTAFVVAIFDVVKTNISNWVVTNLLETITRHVTPHFNMEGGKAPIILTKITSVLVLGIVRACGYTTPGDVLTQAGHAIRAIDTTGEAVNDFLVDVCGLDVDGRKAEQAIVAAHEKCIEDMLRLGNSQWVGPFFENVRIEISAVSEYLRKPKNPKKAPVTGRLSSLLAELTKRFSEVVKAINSTKKRPVPYAIWFYGEPGLGKSEFVTQAFVPYLAKRFNVSPSIYNLESGKYNLPLLAQRFAIYDEAGAKIQKGQTEDILSRLNQLISSSPCQMPGAAVEDKNQTAFFNAVIVISNTPPNQVDFGTVPQAAEALLTRFDVFEVTDEAFNPELGRVDQPHRAPDFSHLSFTPQSHVTRRQMALEHNELANVQQVFDRAEQRIISHTNRFREAPLAFDAQAIPEVAAGTFTLPGPIDFIPHSGQRFFTSIFGPAGCGKTSKQVPRVCGVLSSLGFVKATFGMPRPETTSPCYWVIDDIYDFSKSYGCQDFLRFVETTGDQDAIVTVTNFGPQHTMCQKLITGADWAQCSEIKLFPGVLRRLAWDKEWPESIAIRVKADGSAISYWTGIPCSNHVLIQKYFKYKTGAEFMKVEPFIPEQIPFTKAEADAYWVSAETPPPNPSAAYLMKNISLSVRAGKFFWQHSGGILDSPDWFETLKQVLLHNLCKELPDAKIYIKLPQACFMVYNNTFYVGKAASTPSVCKHPELGWIIVTDKHSVVDKTPITREQVVAYLTNKLPATQNFIDIMAFQALSKAENSDEEIWDSLITSPDYILEPNERLQLEARMKVSRLAVAAEFLKQHWKIGLAVTALTIGTGFIATKVWSYIRRPASEGLPMIHASSYCGACWAGGECTEGKWSPQDEVEAHAKGKTKQGRGKLRGLGGSRGVRRFYWNGVLYYDDDSRWEGNYFVEMMFHNANRRLRAGEYSTTSTHYVLGFEHEGVSYMGKMSRNGGDWYFTQEEAAQAHSLMNDETIDKVRNNTCLAYGNGGKFTIFFLDSRIAFSVCHIVNSVADKITAQLPNGTAVELQCIHYDLSREIAAFIPIGTKGTRAVAVQGIHSLRGMLIDRVKLPVKGFATIVKTNKTNREGVFTGPFHIQPIAYPVVDGATFKHWGTDAGYLSFGTAFCPVEPGNSGSPLLLCTDKGYKILGLHAGAKHSVKQCLFSVLCTEVVLTACDGIAEPHSGIVLEPVIPIEFASQAAKIDPELTVQYPAVNLFQVRNFLPMDTQNSSQPIGHSPLENVFGNLKIPALPAEETRMNHSEKIPPDAAGFRHPANIKLINIQKEKNVSEETAARLIECAVHLADFYKARYGIYQPVQPWSVDKAINGYNADTRIPMDSSNGAAFQLVCPGFPTKKDLMDKREDGSYVFNQTSAGQYCSHLVQKQWDLAAEGKYFALPSATSFKSETLPKEKAWRKRIVNVVDTATVINEKRILAPIMEILTTDGPNSDFILKCNPYTDWNVIAQRLFSHNPDGISSLDFSNFDWTVPEQLFIALSHFVVAFYKDDTNHLLVKRIHTLLHGISKQPILVGNSVISKEHGMLSGIYGTSLCDSIIVKILLFEGYVHFMSTPERPFPSVEEFMEDIQSVGCGDDTTLSVSSQIVDKVYPSVLCEHFQETYQMVATTPSKDASLSGFIPIEEASFCSRGFVRFPGHVAWFTSQLKKEAMSGVCCWTKFTDPADVVTQLDALRAEFVGWGKEKYEAFESAFRLYCIDNNVEYTPRTWKNLIEEAFEVLTTIQMPMYRKTKPEEVQTNFKKEISAAIDQAFSSVRMQPKEKQHASNKVFRRVKMQVDSHNTLSQFLEDPGSDWSLFLQEETLFPIQTRKLPGSTETYQVVSRVPSSYLAIVGKWQEKGEIQQIVQICMDCAKMTPSESKGPTARSYNADVFWNHILDELMESPDSYGAFLSFKTQILGLPVPHMMRGDKSGPSVGNANPVSGATAGRPVATASAIPTGGPLVNPENVQGAPVPLALANMDSLAPPIMGLTGGIDGSLVFNRDFFRNYLSYGEPYWIENIFISTSTQAQAVIRSWDFDPWDPNIIGPMAYKLAKECTTFVGELIWKFTLVTNVMVYGQVAIFKIPGCRVKEYREDLQWLMQFEHRIFDVGQGASFCIPMRGSDENSFTIKRDKVAGGNYGRLVIMTITPINSSFGANNFVSIAHFGAIGMGANYSDVTFDSDLSEKQFDLDITEGIFVADGEYPVQSTTPTALGNNDQFIDPFQKAEFPTVICGVLKVTQNKDAHSFQASNGPQHSPIANAASTLKLAGGVQAEDSSRFSGWTAPTTTTLSCVLNTEKPNLENIKWTANFPNLAEFLRSGCLQAKASTTSAFNDSQNGFGIVGGSATIGTVDFGWNNINAFHEENGEYVPSYNFDLPVSSPTFTAMGCFAGDSDTPKGPGVTLGTQNAGPDVYIERQHRTWPTVVRCTEGARGARPVDMPAGFVAVDILGEHVPNPTVAPAVVGRTIVTDRNSFNLKMKDIKRFSSLVGYNSIITTFTSVNGGHSFQLLRNKHGWFVNASVDTDLYYATFTDSPVSMRQTHSTTTLTWPLLRELGSASGAVTRREAPPAPLSRRIQTVQPSNLYAMPAPPSQYYTGDPNNPSVAYNIPRGSGEVHYERPYIPVSELAGQDIRQAMGQPFTPHASAAMNIAGGLFAGLGQGMMAQATYSNNKNILHYQQSFTAAQNDLNRRFQLQQARYNTGQAMRLTGFEYDRKQQLQMNLLQQQFKNSLALQNNRIGTLASAPGIASRDFAGQTRGTDSYTSTYQGGSSQTEIPNSGFAEPSFENVVDEAKVNDISDEEFFNGIDQHRGHEKQPTKESGIIPVTEDALSPSGFVENWGDGMLDGEADEEAIHQANHSEEQMQVQSGLWTSFV